MAALVAHLQLPLEVWIRVFGYLHTEDKFSVRASCKYFKSIVDHRSLWKHWAVVLSFPSGSYNRPFWSSLRRRSLGRAVVRSTRARDWEQLARSLPNLTALVMDRTSQQSLDWVKSFLSLKHLSIRRSVSPLLFDGSILSQLQMLTHLCICDVQIPHIDTLVSALSRLTNLTSLLCHHTGMSKESMVVIHSVLAHLPKLKHLSLSTVPLYTDPRPPPSQGQHVPALSSLELLNYTNDALPNAAMTLVPGLQTLAVFYKTACQSRPLDLVAWLGNLPQLSTLVLVKGPPLEGFALSIPATVTSLVLRIAGISSQELALVASRLPKLRHLHIDPWPLYTGSLVTHIPKLFPNLRSLKLRHEHVEQRDFLRLCELEHLTHLEILDNRPTLSALTSKLRTLTHNRIQVTTSAQRDLLACPCVCQVY